MQEYLGFQAFLSFLWFGCFEILKFLLILPRQLTDIAFKYILQRIKMVCWFYIPWEVMHMAYL